jgi:hypothetical protein
MTITAKNYAAQAEKYLLNAIKHYPINELDKNSIKNKFLYKIKDAIHFSVPDNGLIFDDNLKGLRGEELRLPFPTITIEYYATGIVEDGFDKSSKRVIFATELTKEQIQSWYNKINMQHDLGDKCICMFTAYFIDKYNTWEFNPFGFAIPTKWEEYNLIKSNGEDGIFGNLIVLSNDLLKLLKVETHGDFKHLSDECCVESSVLLEFLEALSCSNVGFEPIEKVNFVMNAKRIKNGKLPLYETYTLLINTNDSDKSSNVLGGTHKSPRQHLRRGHIRRLPNKKVWVNSTVVGSIKNGLIDKTYALI